MNTRLLAAAYSALFASMFAAATVRGDAQPTAERYARNVKKPKTDTRHIFKTRINPKDGAVMIFIPAGPFIMGDRDAWVNNPRRRVTLP